MVATPKSIFKRATSKAATPKAATPKPATAGKAAKRVKPKDTTITNPRAIAAAVADAIGTTNQEFLDTFTKFVRNENPEATGRQWASDAQITDSKNWIDSAKASGALPIAAKTLKAKAKDMRLKYSITLQELAILQAIKFLRDNGEDQSSLMNTISVNMTPAKQAEEITKLDESSKKLEQDIKALKHASDIATKWESGAKSRIGEQRELAKLEELRKKAEIAAQEYEAAKALLKQ